MSHLRLINTSLVRVSSAARKERKGGHPGLSMQTPERKQRGKKKEEKGEERSRGERVEESRGEERKRKGKGQRKK